MWVVIVWVVIVGGGDSMEDDSVGDDQACQHEHRQTQGLQFTNHWLTLAYI